jgi:hypothetical protein
MMRLAEELASSSAESEAAESEQQKPAPISTAPSQSAELVAAIPANALVQVHGGVTDGGARHAS